MKDHLTRSWKYFKIMRQSLVGEAEMLPNCTTTSESISMREHPMAS